MLGVLKSGNYYIPLDPDHPIDRINMILEEVEPDIVITQEELKERLNQDLKLYIPSGIRSDLPEEYFNNPDLDISPESLAYVIYTSGSKPANPRG